MDPFSSAYSTWSKQRQKTIDELNELAAYVDKVTRDVRIAKITGSSAGVIGGAMTLGGILLVPYTFGTSMFLATSGAALAGGGAITSTGASVAEYYINPAQIKKAQECLEKDYVETEKMYEALAQIFQEWKMFLETQGINYEGPPAFPEEKFVKLGTKLVELGAVANFLKQAATALRDAEFLVHIGGQLGARTSLSGAASTMYVASTTGRGIGAAATKAIIPAFMVVDLFFLISDSINLHNGVKATAFKDIQAQVKHLKENKRIIENIYQRKNKCIK